MGRFEQISVKIIFVPAVKKTSSDLFVFPRQLKTLSNYLESKNLTSKLARKTQTGAFSHLSNGLSVLGAGLGPTTGVTMPGGAAAAELGSVAVTAAGPFSLSLDWSSH